MSSVLLGDFEILLQQGGKCCFISVCKDPKHIDEVSFFIHTEAYFYRCTRSQLDFYLHG